ncbi:MAG TPA: hypothetical protein VMG31_01675 [Verrucomicrobiae bacterium]|nr:hypothetical protein [Verrucomicrobiae bacterium]
MRVLAAAALISAIVLTGCGNNSNNNATAAGLSGNWQMTLQSSSSSSETQSGFLLQSGSALTGALLFSGQTISGQITCAGVGTIQGQTNGASISITQTAPGLTINLTGTSTASTSSAGSSMSGSYSILSAGCGQTEIGTWTATQVSALKGNFQATFTPDSGSTFHFAGTITQGLNTGGSAATISGTMSSSDSPCFTSASIAGLVTGTSATLNLLTSDGQELGKYSGTMTIDASSLSGPFKFSNASDPSVLGACQNLGGNATVAVQASSGTS